MGRVLASRNRGLDAELRRQVSHSRVSLLEDEAAVAAKLREAARTTEGQCEL